MVLGYLAAETGESDMRIVTSGAAYLDIDAYAGCIAYARLLNRQGLPARAVSSAPLNESVSQTLRNWPAAMDSYPLESTDQFVLVDISNPRYFDPLVDLDRVVEVIDHHPGFEGYWRDRLGEGAQIEPIGSVCTQIYERWVEAGLFEPLDKVSAALMATAILDNTLNLKGKITSPRDVLAYTALAEKAGLAAQWPEDYFRECQAAIVLDLDAALRRDSKLMAPDLPLPRAFGQLAVWDAQSVLREQRAQLCSAMQRQHSDWLLNLVSIHEQRSYLVVGPTVDTGRLSDLLGVGFQDGVAIVQPPVLRKEVLAAALGTMSPL